MLDGVAECAFFTGASASWWQASFFRLTFRAWLFNWPAIDLRDLSFNFESCARKHRRRHIETERLPGLEIECKDGKPTLNLHIPTIEARACRRGDRMRPDEYAP